MIKTLFIQEFSFVKDRKDGITNFNLNKDACNMERTEPLK